MPGAAVELRDLAAELGERLDVVLADIGVEERFQNDPSSSVVAIPADPWKWIFPPETVPARRAAAQLLDRWLELGRRILTVAAPETVADFDYHERALRAPLDLSSSADGPGAAEPDRAAAMVQRALAEQLRVIDQVVGAGTECEELWLVPDTNALLKNPALEEWEGDEPATMVIVPQVIRELDRHKQHHPNPDVQAKAMQLVRRFDEFGRRGDTVEKGVRIIGSLSFREVAVDADVRSSLSWLRPDHPDDQLLASVLELRWEHPHRPITLVTEDRNLRNKARLARLATDRAPAPEAGAESAPVARRRQRPIVRVKGVRVEERWPPGRPHAMPPLPILVIELVNVGDRAAVDGAGSANFHPWGDGGGRTPLGSFEITALEPGGTSTIEYTLAMAPTSIVTARSATIEGRCQDIDGNEYPLG